MNLYRLVHDPTLIVLEINGKYYKARGKQSVLIPMHDIRSNELANIVSINEDEVDGLKLDISLKKDVLALMIFNKWLKKNPYKVKNV